jgi:hypothetical protein
MSLRKCSLVRLGDRIGAAALADAVARLLAG